MRILFWAGKAQEAFLSWFWRHKEKHEDSVLGRQSARSFFVRGFGDTRRSMKILLVGAGKMGGALCARWQQENFAEILVCDPRPVSLTVEHVFSCKDDKVQSFDPAVIVLAVKPQVLGEVLPVLRGLGGVFLSVVAGATTEHLRAALDSDAVVRAMPNMPAAVGFGVSVLFAADGVSESHREMCNTLMSAAGKVFWIEQETLFGAVTALSGSGPAYVFYLTECMARAGEVLGLEKKFALSLARDTVCGAGRLLEGGDPKKLRKDVTSPGGTTEAALKILEPLEGLIKKTLESACERSQTLAYEAGRRK